jgi:putative CocE/NonD family hydrolase
MITGWYDWGLNDALATWRALLESGREEVARRCKIIIGPQAHNTLGYLEGIDKHAALKVTPSAVAQSGILTRWYQAVQEGLTDTWPTVIYYLMGANEWRASEAWPPADVQELSLHLRAGGTLTTAAPSADELPDTYTYRPEEPTPTVGGSIVSFLYPVGSVDVSEVQLRSDVRVYTTRPLNADVDVVGPLRMILYVASSAPDTDFAVRLSDVFPDGRAVQLQNGVLRARYRDIEPAWLVPGRVYRLEIDLWGTANRFKAGHRIRVDVSSADFPRFDRNANAGGLSEEVRAADQTIFHDAEHPSQLKVFVMPEAGAGAERVSL